MAGEAGEETQSNTLDKFDFVFYFEFKALAWLLSFFRFPEMRSGRWCKGPVDLLLIARIRNSLAGGEGAGRLKLQD